MRYLGLFIMTIYALGHLAGCGGDGKIPPNPNSEKGQQYLRDQVAGKGGAA